MSDIFPRLFQRTVFKEFAAKQDPTAVRRAYEKFEAHFGNPEVQENLAGATEEQYQSGFLHDLFVEVLGYTLFPHEKYNLITEKRIEKTGQKPDAVIEKSGKVHAVIELKSIFKANEGRLISQVFGYKSHFPECRIAITSNYQTLWFYIDNSAQSEIFTFFNLETGEILPYERFAELYTILQKNNLLSGLPFTLKEQSIIREQELTWAFYNDYQGAKAAFYKNMALNNRKTDKLLLFEKAQKLLDRIVFVCFAQYKGLLPVNHVITIIKEWETLKKLGEGQALYQRFQKHFGYIDQGFVGELYEIFAYNGGLFAQDEILAHLKIDDAVLESHCRILTKYNFRDDIDVNVLGHIFEHSLNELEEKREELVNEKTPKTKRKEDGIFYTPLLITDYMLEETLGKMCLDKQKELGFENLRLEKVQTYRTWLLSLRILDPSCGSGAFLNQVLTFLLKEHQHLSQIEKGFFKKFKEKDYAYEILENNIYGVDINAESVEITKLSLWLRIAEGKRKLNDLSENIKLGNSLIDDPEVDPKAFDWAKQFPKTVEGFDLILGNPPYVSTKIISEKWKKYFLGKYETAKGQFDLYGLFIERGQKMLKKGGKFGYITSSTFLSNKDFVELRRFLFEKTKIEQIVYLGETVFDEAAVDVSILIFFNEKADLHHQIRVIKSRKDFDTKPKTFHKVRQSRFDLEKNNYEIKLNSQEQDFDLIDKIYENTEKLGDILDLPRGIEIGGNSEKIIRNFKKGFEKVLVGKNISRYLIDFRQMYIGFENDKSVFKTLDIYKQPKILIQRIRNLTLKQRIVATLDRDGYLCTNTLRIGILKNENYDLAFILGILNSKVVNFIFSKFFLNKDIYAYQLERIPVPKIDLVQQQPFIEKVNQLLALNQVFHKTKMDLLEMLESELGANKFTRKLENWYELDWNGFSEQLDKSKISVSLKQKKQWKDFFKEEQPKAKQVFEQIQTLENEIDRLVFDLYGLNENEIEMVNG